MGVYDRLGDFLSQALNDEIFFKAERKQKKAENIEERKEKNGIEGSTSLLEADFPEQFATLELKESATKDEIKSAYHRLLKKYHPDNIPSYEAMQRTAREKTRKTVEAARHLLAQFS